MSPVASILRSKPSVIPVLSHTEGKWISRVAVLLFFMPKINLYSVAGESAGLRIDDLILFLFAACITASFILVDTKRFCKQEMALFAFVGWCATSNLINIVYFHRSSLFYSARIIEYFVFFYFGILYTRHGDLRQVARWLLSLNACVMVLQKIGIIGGFTSTEGYQGHLDRAIGMTGGPWEVGALINFCLVVLILDRKMRPLLVLVLFAATTGLILLTASRSALAANFIVLFLWIWRFSVHRRQWIIGAIIAAATCIALLISIPNPIRERSSALFSTTNFDYFRIVYNKIDAERIDPADAFQALGSPKSDEADSSWLMRASKWAVAVKIWAMKPEIWFLGIGPGTCGPSLDGGWIRLLVETGIIGVWLFVRMLRRCLVDYVCFGLIVCLSVNMLMIDIHISYKAMSFVFFVTGYLFARGAHAANPIRKTSKGDDNETTAGAFRPLPSC